MSYFSEYTVSWFFFFFFSSRRRHTRCSRDWSSDVCSSDLAAPRSVRARGTPGLGPRAPGGPATSRSEEHTSELQSRLHLVCRLLLEKKKQKYHTKERTLTTSTLHTCRPLDAHMPNQYSHAF